MNSLQKRSTNSFDIKTKEKCLQIRIFVCFVFLVLLDIWTLKFTGTRVILYALQAYNTLVLIYELGNYIVSKENMSFSFCRQKNKERRHANLVMTTRRGNQLWVSSLVFHPANDYCIRCSVGLNVILFQVYSASKVTNDN